MTEIELSVLVRLSCQRALLGAITPAVRLVTIGWDGQQSFKLKAYFDAAPGEQEKEDFEVVCTEILADISFETVSAECIYSKATRGELAVYKYIVYARKE